MSIYTYGLVYMHDVYVQDVFDVLHKTDPGLEELKITRKDVASKCPT